MRDKIGVMYGRAAMKAVIVVVKAFAVSNDTLTTTIAVSLELEATKFILRAKAYNIFITARPIYELK